MHSDLELCSTDPLTGFFRTGYCETDSSDQGTHTVCAKMTTQFLEFSKSRGNNLMDPAPKYGFEGLK